MRYRASERERERALRVPKKKFKEIYLLFNMLLSIESGNLIFLSKENVLKYLKVENYLFYIFYMPMKNIIP